MGVFIVGFRLNFKTFTLLLLLVGCGKIPLAEVETADDFVSRLNKEFLEVSTESNAASWTYSTFINQDTELLQSKADERLKAFLSKTIAESKRYDGQTLKPETRRAIDLLKLTVPIHAPNGPTKRKELAGLMTKLEGKYGSAKYCPKGSDSCKDQGQLVNIMMTSRNYDSLLDAWTGWHNTSRGMRDDFTRIAQLANEGAREIGYQDVGHFWHSGYNMPARDFEKVTTNLWEQVKPLYNELHCYTRNRLQKTYGVDKVPNGKPIPAHLLGNMWAQYWDEIYPLVEPYKGKSNI